MRIPHLFHIIPRLSPGAVSHKDKSETESEEEFETLVQHRASTPFTYEITLFIQMYLCETLTLEHWLMQRTSVDVDKIIGVFRQIVDGLAHIHDKGIIHRDLKPSNVFLGRDGFWKIGDFGLSKMIEEEDEAIGATGPRMHSAELGTMAYASPEQIRGDPYDTKTDSYSLGVILLELAIHFGTAMERANVLTNVRDGKVPEDLNEAIASLVGQLTDADPDARPEAKELLEHEIFMHKDPEELAERLRQKEARIQQLEARLSSLQS